MLRELRISDLAIIEDLAVLFGPGLNVLSGETGAGKSIILGALGLILGNRATAGIVRTGSEVAEVQARFDRSPAVDAVLAALDVKLSSDDDGLLLRRVLSEAGRSRTWVGNSAVPLSTLRKLAPLLVDYASQQEHRVLLDEGEHGRLLDDFGALQEQRAETVEAIQACRALGARRVELERRDDERQAREDFLRFQLDELAGLDLLEGEWAELEKEQRLLRDAESLIEAAREAEQALYAGAGAAVEQVTLGLRAATRLADADPELAPLVTELQSALVSVEEAGRDLGAYARSLRRDPTRLDAVEARLAEARRLCRKHRCQADELVVRRQRLLAEVEDLEGLNDELDLLMSKEGVARRQARELVQALTAARTRVAVDLGCRVESELSELALVKARFVVDVSAVERSGSALGLGDDDGAPFVTSAGADRVTFLLSSNVGEELRALSRIASGGELSRIVLALHQALAGSSMVQVCVFDEIDSGIGGVTVEAVGSKLAGIAERTQVLCITHLPQIAALADQHYRVDKDVEGGRTRTSVVHMEPGPRVDELVRMVAGTGRTDTAERFARELLDRAPETRTEGEPSRSGSGPGRLSASDSDGCSPSSKGAQR